MKKFESNSKIIGDCTFGKIAFYQYDVICNITINFETSTARTERGYCFGSYGTQCLVTKRNAPKYMSKSLEKLFTEYKEWQAKGEEK